MDEMKLLMTALKWIGFIISFNLVSVGSVGMLTVLRDVFVKGKMVPRLPLIYISMITVGLLILKELIK